MEQSKILRTDIFHQAILNKDVDVIWEGKEKVTCYKGKVVKDYYKEKEFLQEYEKCKQYPKTTIKTHYAEFKAEDVCFFKVTRTLKEEKEILHITK